MEPSSSASSYDMGRQPLDGIMETRGLANHALVAASTEHLTHKMVQKGRKGRQLTLNVQQKILNALNAVCGAGTYALQDLFNYAGRK